MDRRKFLKRTAQAALAGLTIPSLAKAGGSGESKISSGSDFQDKLIEYFAKKKAVDVHHHQVPGLYLDALAGIGITTAGGIAFPEWTPEVSLDLMDRYAIKAAVLSLSSPGTYFEAPPEPPIGYDPVDFAVNLARATNEFGAGAVADYPDRFGLFATVPLPLVEESIEEATYALDTLNADGLVLLASSNDKFLGHPDYEELMYELNVREAVVFIHPNVHSSSLTLNLGLPPTVPIPAPSFLVEFVIDTTRAVTNLIYNGVLERYQNIKWICAHAGGTIPYLAWRLSLLEFLPFWPQLGLRPPMEYLKELYYDTALSPSPQAMAACLELVDPSHILFGSDFPFAPEPVVAKERTDLAANIFNWGIPKFNSRSYRKILTGALKLFPRLR